MFYLAKVLTVIFAITFSCHAQTYVMYPLSIQKCPADGPNPIDFNPSLDTDGFSLTSKLDRNLHENCTFENNIEMWNSGSWIFYSKPKGKVCESLENSIKPAWKRFKTEIKPTLSEGCNIMAESYNLAGFKVSKDEFNVPIPAQGKFRITMRLGCDEEEIACAIAEVQIDEVDEEK